MQPSLLVVDHVMRQVLHLYQLATKFHEGPCRHRLGNELYLRRSHAADLLDVHFQFSNAGRAEIVAIDT